MTKMDSKFEYTMQHWCVNKTRWIGIDKRETQNGKFSTLS